LPFVDEGDDEESSLPFHFEITMAVMDEDEEAVENVFVEAATEIVGEKMFPCENCEKICKSKAGLTRHVNAKHGSKATANANIPSLKKDELMSIVNKVKAKITKEGYWDTGITSNLVKVTSNDNLYEAVSPVYQRFCKKRNQDNFLIEFYELIPKSSALLKCKNQPLCSLVMISISDHLVALFKSTSGKQKCGTSSESTEHVTELSEHERGPLSYIAGYVLAKLQKQCSSKPNEELQVMLQSMKRPSVENTYIDTRSRGGLVTPCSDLVQILEVVEIVFRQFIAQQTSVVSTIPCDTLCNEALESPLLKSLWGNILLGCKDLPKQTTKLCLENIIKLYIKVRSFSYARDYISKFKIKQKAAKSKALRKELKRHNVDK
jgi:uncharacterized C2H2 Zn-finger protein